MDPNGVARKSKSNRRDSSDEDGSSKSKRVCASTPSGSSFEVAGSLSQAERGLVELLSRINPVLSHLVQVEMKKAFETHFPSLLQSLREGKEKGKEVLTESETDKFKLVFCNETASIIFTNNEIRAENGEYLRVAIIDATTNAIVCTGLLSSSQIEFFVLDGEEEGSHRSLSDFNGRILSPRYGKRPLMAGNDKKLTLENGVGLVKNLSITDNSSWMKSKRFRMGAKLRDEDGLDEDVLGKFPNVGVAVSRPFRVMDHRGEVNKKHHPPSNDDEVWRLDGIGKDGAYHKNLTNHGITTVGAFLKAYREMGATNLRKLLGVKVPKKTWTMMVDNAFECVLTLPTYDQTSKQPNLSGNKEAMVAHQALAESYQAVEQKNPGYGFELPELYYEGFIYADPPPLLFEASTSYETLAPNTMKDVGSS